MIGTILSISAIVIAAWSGVLSYTCWKELRSHEEGLRKCDRKNRTYRLELDKLHTQVNKPKNKRGRPRKQDSKVQTLVKLAE